MPASTTYAVLDGAILRCSSGTLPSRLRTTRAIRNNDNPFATIVDFVPLVNIFPFGQCNTAGGYVACIPNTAPWTRPQHVRLNGVPAICHRSRSLCQQGGIVDVVDANTKVTITALTLRASGLEPVDPVEVPVPNAPEH